MLDCLAVYENNLWWSYISHIVPYDKSCMMSHWSLVDVNLVQVLMEDIYGYAGQSYGGSKYQEEDE